MSKNETTVIATEPLAGHHHHHFLCWKSVFGGIVISLMAFVTLTALGAGVFGLRAESLINKEEVNGSALATLGGIWLGLSIIISLFCGSYFALRISRFLTNKIGAAHGFIIASLFFGVLLLGSGNLVGGIAEGLGKAAQGASHGAKDLSASPYVQDSLNTALGTANLKSDPRAVAEGLTARLMQGDTNSAKNYLAYQTGQSPADVDAKINQLKSDFDSAVKQAAEKTARAVADAGWTLFVIFILGLVAALIGGRVGAQSNRERPFAEKDYAQGSSRI